ncbi:hypothetical protein BGZ67_005458 [Mortierella alpina]|nr:hypothetical protein BGZ67_005458 [Mortierella alpina]
MKFLVFTLTLGTHTLFSLLHLAAPIQAQKQRVVLPLISSAYARSGSSLYIAGGWVGGNLVADSNQFVALDLSVPWNASTPSWKWLSNGPTRSSFPAAFSSDGKTMITFRSGVPNFAVLYDVATNLWRPSQIGASNPDRAGVYGVTDPTTNVVYLAGGFQADGLSYTPMVVYHFDSDSVTEFTIPQAGMRNTLFYKGVWWSTSKSILYFGGYNYGLGSQSPNIITQFTPSTGLWSILSTAGTGPASRNDHCMEMSDDGSKLVVFGGRFVTGMNSTLAKSIFVLDMRTMSWTRGPDLLYARLYAACTIVGSTFIAWGGQDDSTVASATATPLIYDLNTNKYTTQFTPPPPQPSSSTTETASPASATTDHSAGDSNTGHTGAIIGGVIGSIGLLGATLGLLFYMRRHDLKTHAGSNASLVMDKLDGTTDEDTHVGSLRRGVYERADSANTKSTLSLLLLAAPVYGQDAVTVVSQAAYARYGTKLYVVGGGYSREVKAKWSGFNTDNEFIPSPDGQFMVLDLSIPWDVSAPAWKRLASGPKQGTFPAAFSADGKTLATFRSEANVTASSHFIWLYHVDKDTWSQSAVTVPDPGKPGRYAVTDPTTNNVYLPGGFEKENSFPMLIYSFDKDSTTQPPLPGRLVDVSHYKAVWWAQEQSILYFGGYVGSRYEHTAPSVIQFTPSTNAWRALTTTGGGPSGRSDHCMEISDDGTKLVVYGGRIVESFKTVFSSELFVLDLPSLQWTLAKDSGKPRVYSVCTIINSTFISWGGQDSQETISAPPILYNLKGKKYLTKFMDPEGDTPAKGSTSGDASSGVHAGGLSAGAIAGIAIGSLAALMCIWCLCCKKWKRPQYAEELVDPLKSTYSIQPTPISRPTTKPGAVKVTVATISPRPENRVSTVTMIEPSGGGYRQYPIMPMHQGSQTVGLSNTSTYHPGRGSNPLSRQSYPLLESQPATSTGQHAYPMTASPNPQYSLPVGSSQKSSVGIPSEAPPTYSAASARSSPRAPQVVLDYDGQVAVRNSEVRREPGAPQQRE